MGNGFDSFKNESAEASMKAAEKEIMEKARAKRLAEEALKPKELGKWEITLKSSTEHTTEDVENFITKLLEFESNINKDFPMMRIHIEPIIDKEK